MKQGCSGWMIHPAGVVLQEWFLREGDGLIMERGEQLKLKLRS